VQPEDLDLVSFIWGGGDAVLVADPDTGRLVGVNPAAERLFGRRAPTVIGLPLEALVPERVRPRVRTLLEAGRTTSRHQVPGTGRSSSCQSCGRPARNAGSN
jgi:PAS domain S-box-containing protein